MSASATPTGASPEPLPAGASRTRSVLGFLASLSLAGRIGLGLVLFWLLVAALGPWLAPHDVGAMVSNDVFDPIGRAFPLGSDYLGRDVLSRLLHGARFTVGLALAAAVIASSTGTALALLAAVSGRRVDELMSRAMDTLISLPSKIFALVTVAAFGPSVPVLLALASITYVPGAFRIARALAVDLNAKDYVTAARARGERSAYVAVTEILPNMIHPMLADFGVRFVLVVLLLSGMSFLGLGVQPPDADLGSLVRENMPGLAEGAPAVIVPAIAIATLTIGMNLLIDSLPLRARRGGSTP
jgi:peptide/nickel transport system permease protein